MPADTPDSNLAGDLPENIGICTIFTKNNLAPARALMASVKKLHPGFQRLGLLADQPGDYFDPAAEDFQVDLSTGLYSLPKNSLFHLKYQAAELGENIKPYYLDFLVKKYKLDKVILLAPEILVYARVEPILAALTSKSIVLLPSQIEVFESSPADKGPASYPANAFSNDTIAISNDDNSRAFLNWWKRSVQIHPADPPQNRLEFVPALFENVEILRNKGFCLQPWHSAHQILVKRKDNRLYLDGVSLRLVKFNPFSPEDAEEASLPQSIIPPTGSRMVAYSELHQSYNRTLADHGHITAQSWPWAFDYFSDGSAIPAIVREVIRHDPEVPHRLKDAFNLAADQKIIDFLNEPAPQVEPGKVLISRLLYHIYTLRKDLQERFTGPLNPDKKASLAEWFVLSGREVYGLPDSLVTPVTSSLVQFIAVKEQSPGEERLNESLNRVLVRLLNAPVSSRHHLPALSRTAYHLYNLDEEAQALFKDPRHADRAAYINWFNRVGAVKYELPVFLNQALAQSKGANTGNWPEEDILAALNKSKGGRLMLEWLGSIVAQPFPGCKYELTQFAYYLLELDPDLAMRFNLRTPAGWDTYVAWFVQQGVKEYRVPAIFVRSMAAAVELETFLGKLLPFDRLLYNLLCLTVDHTQPQPLVPVGAYYFYNTRPDLQKAFSSPLDNDRIGLASWYAITAVKELKLHPALAALTRIRLNLELKEIDSWPDSLTDYLERSFYGRQLLTWLNRDYSPAAAAPVRVTKLAYYLYRSNPVAQALFSDPLGADNLRFAVWFVGKAAKQYQIPEVFLKPVLTSLAFYQAGPLYEYETPDLPAIKPAKTANHFVRLKHSLKARLPGGRPGPVQPEDLRHYFSEWHRSSLPKTSQASLEPALNQITPELGLNIIGYLTSPRGLGEAARRMIASVEEVGLPHTLYNVVIDEVSNEGGSKHLVREGQVNFGYNLLNFNSDRITGELHNIGLHFLKGKYNIGYWYWELNEFPDEHLGAFHHLDEIWVATNFVQEVIAFKSPVPVVKIPPSISPEVASGLTREFFKLPEDRFLFLRMFDFSSTQERKNPQAVIEAFKIAFQKDYSQVGLVLKVSNGHEAPDELDSLRTGLAGLPVWLIDRHLSNGEVNALTALCDCAVSLHRSEGLGLTLAEAMYLGKPVIATAYSGNMDFTHPNNSFLVNYELVKIADTVGPYPRGYSWAEPDIEHAAYQMRQVFLDEPGRTRIARAGQRYIKQNYSTLVTGQAIRNRLNLIRKVSRK